VEVRAHRLASVAAFALALSLARAEGEQAPTAPIPSPGNTSEQRIAAAKTETEEREGDIVTRRLYDDSGAILEESFFDAKGLYERRIYMRSAGRLRRVEARASDDSLLGTLDYRYDGLGRLLAVIPTGSMGSGSVGMIASGPTPSGAWAGDGTSLTVQLLDEQGRQTKVETLAGGKAVERTTYAYAEGDLPVRAEEQDLNAGISVVSDFDAQGKLLVREEFSKGVLSLRTDYRYDSEGRLAEERYRDKGRLVIRSFSYGEKETLEREETRIDGIISEAVEYRGELRIVERYFEGSLFAVTTYAAGRKTKDEFYADGDLIRVKEYQ
jgi:hypothetical protein